MHHKHPQNNIMHCCTTTICDWSKHMVSCIIYTDIQLQWQWLAYTHILILIYCYHTDIIYCCCIVHVCCLFSPAIIKWGCPPAAPEAFLVPLALACGHGLSVARHGGRDPFPCPGWPGVRNSHIVSHWRNIRETSPNNPCSSFSRNASDILCSSLFIISDSNAVDDRTCKPTFAKHSLSLNQHCIPISNLKLSTMLCTVQHIIS